MKTSKRNMFGDQSIEEIRQELMQIRLSKVPDEEYIALLTKHTLSLLEHIESLRMEANTCKRIADSDTLHTTERQGSGQYSSSTSFPETLLKAIDGFYFTIDKSLKITYISPTVYTKLGHSPSVVVNKSLSDILTERSTNNIREATGVEFNQFSQHLNEPLRFEVEFLDKSKNICHFDMTMTYILGEDAYAGFCIDIQKYKDREKELTEAKNNAELNDRLKSEFLANMSHEIRTPLNGIIGFSTMLDRNHLDQAKRDKYLRIIQTSTLHLLTLVNDIIDHSKIEAGQLNIHFTRVDVHQLLDDLLAAFVAEALLLEKKEIRLVKQTGRPRRKIYIKTDEVRLRQVLNNLLGNALKFTEKGDITFGYKVTADNTLRFFVKDNGIGISKEEQQSVFFRYRQSREGRKNEYKGTGLGLAISKGIVELMGGTMGVKSVPGKGSEFYFTLPVKAVV